jgi:hypothetical protein
LRSLIQETTACPPSRGLFFACRFAVIRHAELAGRPQAPIRLRIPRQNPFSSRDGCRYSPSTPHAGPPKTTIFQPTDDKEALRSWRNFDE